MFPTELCAPLTGCQRFPAIVITKPVLPDSYLSSGGIMAYGIAIAEAGDVELYRFGRSKQVFRGPKPDLTGKYFTFVGGSELFGKFVLDPFPRLVGRSIGQTCINLGTPGAGPGFFLKDPEILETCSKSAACVVQVMGAEPLSNRMYSVFPRRNMRLRKVSNVLKCLYPQVDFTKFRYVSATLRTLKSVDAKAYKVVLAEQRAAWLARMLELLEGIETPIILLWIKPEEVEQTDQVITREMVDVLTEHVDRLLEVTIGTSNKSAGNLSRLRKDTGWMTHEAHATIAAAVARELEALPLESAQSDRQAF